MLLSTRIGESLIRWGFGSIVARSATVVYNLKRGARRHFSYDELKNWVNRQDCVTFVSPTVHTLYYSDVRATVEDIWEHDYQAKPGDVIVDIGAGIGTETVVFARQVGPTGRVVAVEAHPRTCEALRRTVRLSRLDNVTVVHAAIADRAGELLISDNDFHIGNSVLGVSTGVPVRAITIDQLAGETGLAEIDYLKMNIEGAEGPAIRGMAATIGSIKHVAIACHDFLAEADPTLDVKTLDAVRAYFKANGFDTVERPDDPRPWVRDQIYGRRRAATPAS